MKSKSKAAEDKVFKNAETLILRYGIKGWNMNDLAGISGITKRTLYRIITSKEQLIRDVAFNNIKAIRDKVVEIIKNESGFMDRMDKLIVAIPELFKNNYINNYSDILNEFPELEAELVKESDKLSVDLRNFFQTGIDGGYLRNDITPVMVQQMVQASIIYFAKYSSSESEVAEKIKISLNCLVHGISIRSDKRK